MNAITRQMLEDVEDLPPQMQEEALDFVRFLKLKLSKSESVMPEKEANGTKLAQLMEEMSRKDLFSEIEDPVAWQREIRKDRPLPGNAVKLSRSW